MKADRPGLGARILSDGLILPVAGLVTMVLIAWAWIVDGAGTGMSGPEMTRIALFPHLQDSPSMPGMETAGFAMSILMWWVMMAAMMLPAATPLILLYARVVRREQRFGRIGADQAPVAWMLAGYLSVWLGFSVLAAGIQCVLAATGLISDMMLWSQSRWLSAALLALAALFQLTPLKRTCLSACRHPVAYLSDHWRPGRRGAFGMGLIHGADCLGCCWALMLLLFVGGVMNLLWIGVLGGLVLLERLAPFGPRTLPFTSGILWIWSVATLVI